MELARQEASEDIIQRSNAILDMTSPTPNNSEELNVAGVAVGEPPSKEKASQPPSASVVPAAKRAAGKNTLDHSIVIDSDGLVSMKDSIRPAVYHSIVINSDGLISMKDSIRKPGLDDEMIAKIAANAQSEIEANADDSIKKKKQTLLAEKRAISSSEEATTASSTANGSDGLIDPIHNLKLASTQPGAMAVTGMDYEDVIAEQDVEENEEKPVSITATAVTKDDLEAQVRNEILDAAVTAFHVELEKEEEEPSFFTRKYLKLAGCCICLVFIVVAVGAVVGVIVGTRSENSLQLPPLPPKVNSGSPPPTIAPTHVPVTVPVSDNNDNALTEEEAYALVLFDFLYENAPNQKSRNALLEELSAPYEAYLWLVQDTERAPTAPEDYQLLQRFALANLYYSMRGPDWSRNDGWLSRASICEWFGAVCADNTMDYLVRLDLSNNSLQGKLTPELVFLTKLRRLDLSDNRIDGKLPKALSNITSIGRFGYMYCMIGAPVCSLI
jgi:Leucine-rich repeat (LRR) protein